MPPLDLSLSPPSHAIFSLQSIVCQSKVRPPFSNHHHPTSASAHRTIFNLQSSTVEHLPSIDHRPPSNLSSASRVLTSVAAVPSLSASYRSSFSAAAHLNSSQIWLTPTSSLPNRHSRNSPTSDLQVFSPRLS